jgi:hypothetical protein
MQSRVTHLMRIAFVVVLTAAVVPTAALAGKPETKQFATYLSGVLPLQPSPAESGRAEAKQIAAYLSGFVSRQPSPAESGRAEAKAFANFMRGTMTRPYPTPAESSRAETNAFANWLGNGKVPIDTVAIDAVSEPSGFDWGDAGIGAGVTLGGIVLLLASLVACLRIVRHHHGRRQVPST